MGKKIIAYLACAAVIAFYVGVLTLTFKPDTTLEYKLYYLTNDLDFYVEDGGLRVNSGERYTLGVDNENKKAVAAKGWYESQDNYVWGNGVHSEIWFTYDNVNQKDIILSISAKSAEIDRTVIISINDKQIGTIVTKGNEFNTFTVAIPQSYFDVSEYNKLSFDCVEDVLPINEIIDTEDVRNLGIGVAWIQLDEVN